MRTPTIHLNGTSKNALLENALAAHAACRAAICALEDMGPNARDYYPQGADAYSQAYLEHRARVERLLSVRLEIAAIVEAIAEGG